VRHPSMPPTRPESPSLRTIRPPRPVCQGAGPGARSVPMAAGCAVSHPALFRAPHVPGPFAAAGRAVRCRDGTYDADRPGRPALRAAGRHAGLDRLGPRPRPPHPPPVPRPARGRAEHRRRLRPRHQRTTAPATQPRPGVVVRDHDQPQPGHPVPAHAVTVRRSAPSDTGVQMHVMPAVGMPRRPSPDAHLLEASLDRNTA